MITDIDLYFMPYDWKIQLKGFNSKILMTITQVF